MSPRDDHEPFPTFEDAMASLVSRPRVEPSSEMRTAASQLRGFYNAFLDEGFTADQALRLIMSTLNRGQAS